MVECIKLRILDSIGVMLAAGPLGMELVCRLGLGPPTRLHEIGYHPTAVAGGFGGVFALSHLRGHDQATTLDALGAAGSLAAGLSDRAGRGAALRRWLRAPASLPADHANRPIKPKRLQSSTKSSPQTWFLAISPSPVGPNEHTSRTTQRREGRPTPCGAGRSVVASTPCAPLGQAGWHLCGDVTVPANITLPPLPPQCPEVNIMGNVWQFMRDDRLSSRVFRDHHDIVGHCCHHWNRLADQPWPIMPIRPREWAHGF